MKSGNGKNIKKAFTYFIGFYFLVFGTLISCGDAMAANLGEKCTTVADCGVGPNGALMKCERKSSMETTTVCKLASDTSILQSATNTSSISLKEDYHKVNQATSTNPLKFTPQVSIPSTTINGTVDVGSQVGTKMVSTLLPTYIGAFYKYGLTIVGILATVILMAGGIVWLTSAGNDSKVTQAKEMIFSSLAGIFLLYGSYIILNTINPDLVKLKAIESPSIAKVTLDTVCCQTTTSAEMMDAKECAKKGGARMTGYVPEDGVCVKLGCCMRTRTIGGVTKTTSCSDSTPSKCYEDTTATSQTVVKNSFIKASCSIDTRCLNLKNSAEGFNECKDATDGGSCHIGGTAGYCYSNICFLKDGKDGEPCGNDGGSICRNLSNGTCTNQDRSGGRNCDGSDVWCCAKGAWTETKK